MKILSVNFQYEIMYYYFNTMKILSVNFQYEIMYEIM